MYLSIHISNLSSRCLAETKTSNLEPRAGIEPATSSLPRMCSTPELPGPNSSSNAGIWSGWRESNPRHQLGRLRCYHCTTPAFPKRLREASSVNWWRGLDSNQRRLSQQIYSLPPLATREPLRFAFPVAANSFETSRAGRARDFAFLMHCVKPAFTMQT